MSWGTTFNPREFLLSVVHEHFATIVRPATDEPELIMCCGWPASGKSTFVKKHFAAYVYVNQDTLKTVERCVGMAGVCDVCCCAYLCESLSNLFLKRYVDV